MSSDDAASFLFLAENSIDIICRAGLDMVLHYVAPSSFHVLGWKPEEMTGKRPDAFFLPEDASALADNSVAIVRMRMKDGMMAWVEIKHRMVCDSVSGVPRENIIVIRDITERKTLEERLSVSESTDSRTDSSLHAPLMKPWNASGIAPCAKGRFSLCCYLTSITSDSSMTGANIWKAIAVWPKLPPRSCASCGLRISLPTTVPRPLPSSSLRRARARRPKSLPRCVPPSSLFVLLST